MTPFRDFIEARDMFFLATADATGQPQCSYKGGDPGFVRVVDSATTGNHPDNPTLMHPCRQVFAAGSRPTDVTGPLIEDEAAEAHRDFWA